MSDMTEELEWFLAEKWDELRTKYPNVINVGIGKKIKDDEETDEFCLIFYVSDKVDKMKLRPAEVIPPIIDDVCTDVQPIKPSTWVAGETEPSKRNRVIQKRLGGGVKR